MADITTAQTAAAYAAVKTAGDAYLTAFDAAFAPVVAAAGGLPDPAYRSRQMIAQQFATLAAKAAALAVPATLPPTST